MYDVSICIPYFERIGPFRKAVESFKQYDAKRVEIVVVDDGSINEPIEGSGITLPNMRVYALPEKQKWRNPCVPLNMAVGKSTAPVILLQGSETRHPESLVFDMLTDVKDYKDIVLGCVKEGSRWLTHPAYRPKRWWFCQMMTRRFFDEVGGFDERFRNEGWYDDVDLEFRLTAAGANWIWREDCVAYHEPHQRERHHVRHSKNRRLFIKKHGVDPDG